MNWTMPRPVLQWVAAVLGLASIGSFAVGVATAPDRGRLPGEPLNGASGAPLQATEATPLGEERIEGPPPPPELTEEEKAKLEEEKQAKAAAAARARSEAEAAAGAVTPPPAVAPPTPAPEPPPPPPKAQTEEPVF
jgi:hypothetical protein